MTVRYDPTTSEWMFQYGDGWRKLEAPHGSPTARQLLRLNHLGRLQIRDEPGEPVTKLDAALALDRQEQAA
jgi:hypothetical protein